MGIGRGRGRRGKEGKEGKEGGGGRGNSNTGTKAKTRTPYELTNFDLKVRYHRGEFRGSLSP